MRYHSTLKHQIFKPTWFSTTTFKATTNKIYEIGNFTGWNPVLKINVLQNVFILLSNDRFMSYHTSFALWAIDCAPCELKLTWRTSIWAAVKIKSVGISRRVWWQWAKSSVASRTLCLPPLSRVQLANITGTCYKWSAIVTCCLASYQLKNFTL